MAYPWIQLGFVRIFNDTATAGIVVQHILCVNNKVFATHVSPNTVKLLVTLLRARMAIGSYLAITPFVL